MSQVDKALKAFEYTTEWADLIAALGKLNGVLLKHMKYPIIPRRIVISKVSFWHPHIIPLYTNDSPDRCQFIFQRLAQCMHPALPSGEGFYYT